MKSLKVILIALFPFFSINLDAQVFVGGSLGFSNSSDKTENSSVTTYKSSSYSFSFLPIVGKFLSEDLAVGLSLNVTLNESKTGISSGNQTESSTIGGSPFLRYYPIKWNKLSVFGQGNIGLNFSRSSTKTGSGTSDGPKITKSYLKIYPGLAYAVSDKFSLETSLNFLSFGYYHLITKNGSYKDQASSFNIGAGLDGIVTVGNITIGAIYKF